MTTVHKRSARSIQAEAAFRARVEELGGVVLEPTWRGSRKGHRVRCAEGHESTPRPGGIQQGKGVCGACAGNDPKAAEAAFRARVRELGGEVLERSWLGKNEGHRVRCAAGHEGTPRPNSVQQGQGLCRTCAGNDPKVAEAEFRARVEALGGVVLEPAWLGKSKGHRVRCAEGHEIAPQPSDVQQGRGICRTCAGRAWDVFYVVSDEVNGIVKFGITSGDPRPRLRNHARDGLNHAIRLIEGMSDASALESACRAALRDARESPVRGREYFPARVLGLILDVVDGWTSAGLSVHVALTVAA